MNDVEIISGNVVDGNQVLPWGLTGSILKTHGWKIVVWQGLFRKAASEFPVFHLHPSCHGKSPALSSARPNKGQCPFILKLHSLELMWSVTGPRWPMATCS